MRVRFLTSWFPHPTATLLNLRGSVNLHQQPPLTSPTELPNLPLSIHPSEGGIMHVSITYCVQ